MGTIGEPHPRALGGEGDTCSALTDRYRSYSVSRARGLGTGPLQLFGIIRLLLKSPEQRDGPAMHRPPDLSLAQSRTGQSEVSEGNFQGT